MGLFGKKIEPKKDSSVYTPLEELTLEEKTEFGREKFVLGRIPDRPPAREMCV